MLLEAIQELTPPFDADSLGDKSGRSKPGTARLNLTDDNEPVVPLSIATQVSPAGAGIAGVYGLGLISLAATSPGGFNALRASWEIYERKARENNRSIDRTRWTLAGPVHIAETRQQAFDNICYGLAKWVTCFHELVALPLVPLGKTADMARELVDSGLVVIGSPEDAVRQLSRLQEQSGGFGCFLQMGHQWADQEQTRKSYQLFAEQVAPVFQRHAGQSQ
jgi:limonene 1,2-monooxygenase